MDSPNQYIAGIDLGTTTCYIGIMNNGRPEIVDNGTSGRQVESIISFKDGLLRIGRAALQAKRDGDKNTIYDIKRIIGLSFNDKLVKDEIGNWEFNVVDVNNCPRVVITYDNKEEYWPLELISACLIKHMVELASARTKSTINDIIITCPAHFSQAQCKATRIAGEIAGYNVLDILKEPCAAAIAYGFQNRISSTILIFDLGGGTFDTSLLRKKGDDYEVIGFNGDNHCGGNDIDRIVYNKIVDLARAAGCDVSTLNNNPRLRMKILTFAKEAKEELSSTESFSLHEVGEAFGMPDSEFSLTRKSFEEAIEEFLERPMEKVRELLKEQGMTPQNIDEVVLVGGSSRIPLVHKLIGEMFGVDKISKKINPDEAVAMGAIIYAQSLHPFQDDDNDNRVKVRITLPRGNVFDIGTELAGLGNEDNQHNQTRMDVENNSEEMEEDDDKEFDSDLAIRNIPNGIIDRIPLAYGIASTEGFQAILNQNDLVTKTTTRYFRTSYDNQTLFSINIGQFSDSNPDQFFRIGQYEIRNLPPLPKGKVLLAVKFQLNERTHDLETSSTAFMLNETTGERVVLQEVQTSYEQEAIFLSDSEVSKLRMDFERAMARYKENEKKVHRVNLIKRQGKTLIRLIREKGGQLSQDVREDGNKVAQVCLACSAARSNEELDEMENAANRWTKYLQRM